MAEVTRKRVFLLSVLAVIAGFLLVAMVFLLRLRKTVGEIGASRFGIQKIGMPQSGVLYAKRETRGQNFDVVAISRNPNACESANPNTDLIFKYDGNPLTFTRSGDTLIVLRRGGYEMPKQGLANVEVKQIGPGEIETESSSAKKIQSIDIPLQFARHGPNRCDRQ